MKTAHILYKQNVTSVITMLQYPGDYSGTIVPQPQNVLYFHRAQTPHEFRVVIQNHMVQTKPRDFKDFKFYWIERKLEREWA